MKIFFHEFKEKNRFFILPNSWVGSISSSPSEKHEMKNKIKNAVESQQNRTTNRIHKTKYRVSNQG